MDKKEAEQDAMRKAKENQNAAGKNTGMSGRDLVRLSSKHILLSDKGCHSSNITPNGLPTTTKQTKTIGIFPSTGRRRRMNVWPLKRNVLPILDSLRDTVTKMHQGAEGA